MTHHPGMTDHPESLDLAAALDALVSIDEPAITALANAAALLYERLDEINWAGFYLMDGDRLALGPFCGKPACTTIPIGSGVCGTAAAERRTLRVDDVDRFPGHIACDAASRSEIVVPIVSKQHGLIGVMDIDAPVIARFSADDQTNLEAFAGVLLAKLDPILSSRPTPRIL
jgi:GAF domain-containing protein